MIVLNDSLRGIEISDSGSELGPIRVNISFHFNLSFSVCSQDKKSRVGDFYQFGHSFLFHTLQSVYHSFIKLDWKTLSWLQNKIYKFRYFPKQVSWSVKWPVSRPPDRQCLYLTLFWYPNLLIYNSSEQKHFGELTINISMCNI